MTDDVDNPKLIRSFLAGAMLGILCGAVPGAGTPVARENGPGEWERKFACKPSGDMVEPFDGRMEDALLANIKTQSRISVAHWARALMQVPRSMQRDKHFRAELAGLIECHGPDGVIAAAAAGISCELIALEFPAQPAENIPGLISALLSQPELVASSDIGQITHAILRSGPHGAKAMEIVATFLQKHRGTERKIWLQVAGTVGNHDEPLLEPLLRCAPDIELLEAMKATTVSAMAARLPPGDELSEALDRFFIGKGESAEAYQKAGYGQAAKVDASGATISWMRSLSGYRQLSAIEGWVNAIQDEHDPMTPLNIMLGQPSAVSDQNFAAMIFDAALPEILSKVDSADVRLLGILAANPDFESRFRQQKALQRQP